MKKILIILSFILGQSVSLWAQKSEVFVKEDAAIRGYDAVAYFTESKPVKGKKEFSFNYKGATWLFSNKQNLDAFKSNPGKYEPQYGGYCAYGLADGHKA
ncbi:MAG: YHS domain-containing (seleno)protein, partial [Bacteroidota bacterium]